MNDPALNVAEARQSKKEQAATDQTAIPAPSSTSITAIRKKPSEYAESFPISAAHLNDTLKQRTGRSTMSIIQEHCVKGSKSDCCIFTDLSIKEIAYNLGYPNPKSLYCDL